MNDITVTALCRTFESQFFALILEFFFTKVSRISMSNYTIDISIPPFLGPLVRVIYAYTYIMRCNWKKESNEGSGRQQEDGFTSHIAWNTSYDGSTDDCPIVLRMKMKGARNQPFKTVGINSVLESLMTMWKSDGLENVAKATLRKRS